MKREKRKEAQLRKGERKNAIKIDGKGMWNKNERKQKRKIEERLEKKMVEVSVTRSGEISPLR